MNPFRFIGGLNIKQAFDKLHNTSYIPIFDYAKESSKSLDEIKEYIEKLKKDAEVVKTLSEGTPSAAFALKYSSFGEFGFMKEAIDILVDNKIGTIFLDAEQHDVHHKEKEIYDKLIHMYNKKSILLYKTYQMYRCDSMLEIAADISKYEENNIKLGMKLVRGAYYHQDSNKGVLYRDKQSTDDNYNMGIRQLLNNIRNNANIHVVFATHNDISIQLATQLVHDFDISLKNHIGFAQLLGMNEKAGEILLANNWQVYKYVPYGSLTETLPYLTRRLYENNDILSHAR